jgi:putative two-component system response regulator
VAPVAAMASMLWWVAGTVGLVELIRFSSRRWPTLGGRWPQAGIMAGFAAAAAGAGHDVLHLVQRPELGLFPVFLALLEEEAALLLGTVAVIAAVPGAALFLALPAAAAGILLGLRRSPAWAAGAVWVLLLAMPSAHPGPARALALAGLLALGTGAFSYYVRSVDRARRELEHARRGAETDPLTGALNRTGLHAWLDRHAAQRGTAVLLDLDDFKLVNELFGHAVGDALLHEAVRRWRTCLRASDALARLGGDEFVAVAPGVGGAAAGAVAERLLRALETPLRAGDPPITLTVRASAGVATGPLLPSLVAAADEALLSAKADGKNRWTAIDAGGGVQGDGQGADALLRVTAVLRLLLQDTPCAVLVTDPAHRVLAATPAYVVRAGLAPHRSYQGAKPDQLTASGLTDPAVRAAMQQALATSGRWQGELLNRRPDGSLWWSEWEIGAVQVQGHFLGYIGSVRDATPRHRQDVAGMAQLLAACCDRHEPGLGAHLRRTAAYAEAILRRWHAVHGRAGVDVEPEDFALAALLHDLGKLGVPQGVLCKPGALLATERALVEQHPRLGWEMLQALRTQVAGARSDYLGRLLDLAAEVVLRHHERWDGHGYPDGLAGSDIPLAARLFAVVDVFDALRSPRPYKPAWPAERARSYVERAAGTQFDPAAVAIALQVLNTFQDLQGAPGTVDAPTAAPGSGSGSAAPPAMPAPWVGQPTPPAVAAAGG